MRAAFRIEVLLYDPSTCVVYNEAAEPHDLHPLGCAKSVTIYETKPGGIYRRGLTGATYSCHCLRYWAVKPEQLAKHMESNKNWRSADLKIWSRFVSHAVNALTIFKDRPPPSTSFKVCKSYIEDRRKNKLLPRFSLLSWRVSRDNIVWWRLITICKAALQISISSLCLSLYNSSVITPR